MMRKYHEMRFDHLCGAPEDEPGISREELEQTVDLDLDDLAIEPDDREGEDDDDRPGVELAPEPLRPAPAPPRVKAHRKPQVNPAELGIEEDVSESPQHGAQGRRTSAWIPLFRKMKILKQ